MSKNKQTSSSLCGLCKNSVGLCSWSAHFIPIEGWEAERVMHKGQAKEKIQGYRVISCPKFIKHERAKVPVPAEAFKKRAYNRHLKSGRWNRGELIFVEKNCRRLSVTEISKILRRSEYTVMRVIENLGS